MRLMGDATRAQAATLAAVPGLQLVAGYDTGSPDIDWTPAEFALFPGIPHLTIDQAFIGAPRYDSDVIDVEAGAYSPDQVARWMNNATAPRPTIYVNRGNEAQAAADALESPRFRGDVWLSYPGWQPGWQLPALPAGCRYVAIQNQLDVAGAYDLSVVLDPSWPEGGIMEKILQVDRATVPIGVNWPGEWHYAAGVVSHIETPERLAALQFIGLTTQVIPYATWQALSGVV